MDGLLGVVVVDGEPRADDVLTVGSEGDVPDADVHGLPHLGDHVPGPVEHGDVPAVPRRARISHRKPVAVGAPGKVEGAVLDLAAEQLLARGRIPRHDLARGGPRHLSQRSDALARRVGGDPEDHRAAAEPDQHPFRVRSVGRQIAAERTDHVGALGVPHRHGVPGAGRGDELPLTQKAAPPGAYAGAGTVATSLAAVTARSHTRAFVTGPSPVSRRVPSGEKARPRPRTACRAP